MTTSPKTAITCCFVHPKKGIKKKVASYRANHLRFNAGPSAVVMTNSVVWRKMPSLMRISDNFIITGSLQTPDMMGSLVG